MVCVRCLKATAKHVAKAPDGSNAWVVYCCESCNYSWRSSEGDTITDISKRSAEFQMENVDLTKLINMIPIPPLKS